MYMYMCSSQLCTVNNINTHNYNIFNYTKYTSISLIVLSMILCQYRGICTCICTCVVHNYVLSITLTHIIIYI